MSGEGLADRDRGLGRFGAFGTTGLHEVRGDIIIYANAQIDHYIRLDERGERDRSKCISNAENWFSMLDFHIEYDCYSLEEGEETTVVGFGVYTRDISSTFEYPFQPKLHLFG